LFALNADELFAKLSLEISRKPGQRSFDFLAGFTTEEIQSLISQLALLTYEPGEFVFRQNDQSLGMFCIMRGQVEVLHLHRGKEKTVAILNEGDIFGEMGFVAKTERTASIRVREEAELLVLAPKDLDKLTLTTPDLGIKFLSNLFRIVVERYINVLNQDME
jgi:CRP-like cAMP-binding protein